MHDYETFCAAAHPHLVAAFTHQFGDRWLAEELAQEALIRAGVRWGRVSGLASPVGWTFRVGCNLGTSVMRRRAVEQRALSRAGAAVHLHTDPDTSEQLAVRAALEVLTDTQRRVIVARYLLGLNTHETAAALGIGVGNVRVLTHRALQQLRSRLDLDEEAVDVR